LILHSIFIIC